MSSSGAENPPPPVFGEGLFASGVVALFGRPFTGLKVGDIGLPATVHHQLAASIRKVEQPGRDPSLARIYGFNYLGNYRKLAEPLIFLVFAPGQPVRVGGLEPEPATGLVGLDLDDEASVRGLLMWTCDQLDMAVRVDVRIGWLKDLLLSEADSDRSAGGDSRRAEIVGRDANLVGRAINLIGRDR